jgi:probable addiction module antidote protein
MPKRSRPHRETLLAHLRDPRTAAEYLNAALDDSDELFLKAIRDVAEAHELPMTKIAEGANVSRENLYRMLSESGNPRFENLTGVLRVLGLRIAVEADLRPNVPGTS